MPDRNSLNNMRNNIQLQSQIPLVTTPPNTAGGQVLGLLLTLAFVAVLFWSGPQFMMSLESNGWPTTTAQITRSEAAYVAPTTSDSSGTYRIYLEYHFKVKDVDYSGQKETFGIGDAFHGFNRGDGSKEIVAQYPPGAEVTVHYNPKNPALCVLKTGPTIGLYYVIAFSIFAIFCQLQYMFEQFQGVGTRATPMAFVRTFGFMAFFLGAMLSLFLPMPFRALGNLIQPNAHVVLNGHSSPKAPILDKSAINR